MGLYVPKRWILVIFLHTAILLEYTLRVNLSVAAIPMKEKYNWSEHEKGLMLSAFYWGYTFGQIPVNILVYHFKAKYILAISLFLSSLFTLLSPSACNASFSSGLLNRALVGLFASATYPACFHYFSPWIPLSEKTLLINIILTGAYMGEVVCFAFSGLLLSYNASWMLLYSFFGWMGIIWVPLWLFFAYETPAEHPTISSEELEMITRDSNYNYSVIDNDEKEQTERYIGNIISLLCDFIIPAELRNKAEAGDVNDDSTPPSEIARRVPWAAFFIHPTSLTMIIVYWTQCWILYMVLTELPTYLTEVLHYPLANAGFLSVLPYVLQLLATLLVGWIFHVVQDKYNYSTDAIRQIAQFVSFLGSSLPLLLCGYVTNSDIAYVLMVISITLYGATQCGIGCAFVDVTPNYASTLNTIANVFGSFAGLLAPITVSSLTSEYKGILGWRYVFYITFAQCAFSLILWVLYQTSDIVPLLNSPRPKKTVAYKEWCPWFRY